MSPQYRFVTQRQLGQIFGVSSHVIGRWLIEVGLRTSDKKPSQRAYDESLVQFVSDGDVRFWAWNKEAVTSILEQAGHKRTTEALAIDVPSEFLVGPFIAHRSDTEGDGDGFEIADVKWDGRHLGPWRLACWCPREVIKSVPQVREVVLTT